MQVEAPKNIKSWIKGFFSGSFKGNLEGSASYAETASYLENFPDLSDQYLPVTGGTVSGNLFVSGSTKEALRVEGDSNLYGDLYVSGNLAQRGDEFSMSSGKIKLIRSVAGNLEFRIKK